MKVVFVGECQSRDIVVAGGVIRAERDVPVDVPDVVGRSLLEQDVFTTPNPPKPPKPARAAKKIQEKN